MGWLGSCWLGLDEIEVGVGFVVGVVGGLGPKKWAILSGHIFRWRIGSKWSW